MFDKTLAETEREVESKTGLIAIVEEPPVGSCKAELTATLEAAATIETRELVTLNCGVELTGVPVPLTAADERTTLLALPDGDDGRIVVFAPVARAPFDVAELPGKRVDGIIVLVTVVFSSSGLRVAVC